MGQSDREPATWAVHRQDDNGQRFLVRGGLGREEAEELAAELARRGHKQLYWVEPEPVAGPRPGPGGA
jgi:phage replication-related protein YjqB (UPF0714/DUF867 family)